MINLKNVLAQYRPFIKDKNFSTDEVLSKIEAGIKSHLEDLIHTNRKINWESEFERGNYCIGENIIEDFIG